LAASYDPVDGESCVL